MKSKVTALENMIKYRPDYGLLAFIICYQNTVLRFFTPESIQHWTVHNFSFLRAGAEKITAMSNFFEQLNVPKPTESPTHLQRCSRMKILSFRDNSLYIMFFLYYFFIEKNWKRRDPLKVFRCNLMLCIFPVWITESQTSAFSRKTIRRSG